MKNPWNDISKTQPDESKSVLAVWKENKEEKLWKKAVMRARQLKTFPYAELHWIYFPEEY